MDKDGKRRAGRVLTFAVTGALLVAGPLGCGGSETHVNEREPEPVHTNEPADVEPTTGETGGGEDTGGGGVAPPEDVHPNEPAPGK